MLDKVDSIFFILHLVIVCLLFEAYVLFMLTIIIFNVDKKVWKERTSPQDVDSQFYLFSLKYFNVLRKKYSTFRPDDVYIRVPTSASSMRPTHLVHLI